MTDSEEAPGRQFPAPEFKELEEADFPILLKWLLRPHVREWWDEGEHTIEKVREAYGPEEGVGRYIALLPGTARGDVRPFGLFQYYRADNATIGIDQFIGEPELIGIGLGTRAVVAFTHMIFERLGPDRIILDPSPDNPRAIRCYEKAGFRHFETTAGVNGEPAYFMELLRDEKRR